MLNFRRKLYRSHVVWCDCMYVLCQRDLARTDKQPVCSYINCPVNVCHYQMRLHCLLLLNEALCEVIPPHSSGWLRLPHKCALYRDGKCHLSICSNSPKVLHFLLRMKYYITVPGAYEVSMDCVSKQLIQHMHQVEWSTWHWSEGTVPGNFSRRKLS